MQIVVTFRAGGKSSDLACADCHTKDMPRVQLEPDQKLRIEIGQAFCDLRGIHRPAIHQEACPDDQYILAAFEPEHRS